MTTTAQLLVTLSGLSGVSAAAHMMAIKNPNSSVYPSQTDVRLGVQYGPASNDFTGSLIGGGGVVLRRS